MLIYLALGGTGLLLLLVMLIAGELGDHDGHIDHASPFGIRIIATFLMFFGVGGIIGQYLVWGHPASSGLGVGLGLVGATLLHRFASLLHGQQASSELSIGRLVGRPAHVTIAIPENGVGEVSLTAFAEQTAQLARSADGAAIASGRAVVIKGVVGGQVLVEVTR